MSQTYKFVDSNGQPLFYEADNFLLACEMLVLDAGYFLDAMALEIIRLRAALEKIQHFDTEGCSPCIDPAGDAYEALNPTLKAIR